MSGGPVRSRALERAIEEERAALRAKRVAIAERVFAPVNPYDPHCSAAFIAARAEDYEIDRPTRRRDHEIDFPED